jgi:hypothetical protein
MQALEAQTQGLLAFVQQLGEQQGWQIPAQLIAPPPRPPPPPRRESTPVSMSTLVLLSVLMLSVKPSVSLRAGFVDLSAFVPELLIFRPSCRKCGCRSSCRPSCRFWKPPNVEEVLPKFSIFLKNLDFYLVTHVQFLFIQRYSGASSNHVRGSPGSHV